MSLYHKIVEKYPELTADDFHHATGVISLRDDSDGFGPWIARWEHPTLAQPSDEELGITRNPANVIIEGEVIAPVEMVLSDAKIDMSQLLSAPEEDAPAGGA